MFILLNSSSFSTASSTPVEGSFVPQTHSYPQANSSCSLTYCSAVAKSSLYVLGGIHSTKTINLGTDIRKHTRRH